MVTGEAVEQESDQPQKNEPENSDVSAEPCGGYTTLDAAHIHCTVKQLSLRIEQRFPSRGICRICRRLEDLSRNVTASIEGMTKPICTN